MDRWRLLERIFGWGGVIAYHGVGESVHSPVMHVTPARLRAQLEYLRERHHVLPLREMLSRWSEGRSTRGCVAITFDDAYVGVARWAAPILQELALQATVFVASDFAAAGASFWWDTTERDRLADRPYRWTKVGEVLGLGDLPAGDRGTAIVREHVLSAHAGRWPSPLAAADAGTVWRSLTLGELRALAQYDGIDFGVHTRSHPALPLLSRSDQVEEIRDSYAVLAAELPRVLPVVAYPYGLYDRGTVAAARAAGMTAGLTMEGRAPSARPETFTVPRVGVGDLHPPQSVERRLNRALRPALIARNGGVHPRVPLRIIATGPSGSTPPGARTT